MMRLLLDTHIWLWSLLDRSRLSHRVVATLADAKNELWLSPFSVWEVLMLCEKRRLQLDPDPVTWVRNALSSIPFRQASINYEVAMETERVQLGDRDPTDRFLVATAPVFELTLFTSDATLLNARAVPVLANR